MIIKLFINYLSQMIDEPLASNTDLIEALKDGVALCKYVHIRQQYTSRAATQHCSTHLHHITALKYDKNP
jgi:hypothetical protein